MAGAVESLNVSVAAAYASTRRCASAVEGGSAMPVIEVKHPLVKHKIGLLREAEISTKKFRELTGEVAQLLTYEATADFPVEATSIDGWCGPTPIEQIAGKKVTVVPILRAGLGMLDGVLEILPNVKVSVVGLARDHETLKPVHYFERLSAAGAAHRADRGSHARHRRPHDCDHRPKAQRARLQGHPRPGAGGGA